MAAALVAATVLAASLLGPASHGSPRILPTATSAAGDAQPPPGTGGPLTEPEALRPLSPFVRGAASLPYLLPARFATAHPAPAIREAAPPEPPPRWSILVAGDPTMAAITEAVRAALEAGGAEARSPDLPGQPDAVLVLSSVSGPAAAWYCQSAGSGSAPLAGALVAALPAGASMREPAAFSCGSLVSRWPRTPAALLQLPATSSAADDLAGRIAHALQGYLDVTASTHKEGRTALRLLWPATGGITSYMDRSHPLGIDIGQKIGPVFAATDGVVSFAGGNTCCSYGRYVVIDSPDGIRTIYGHLASLAVRTGDRVKAGQTLGQVGCTGKCNGPHLHFEVIDNGVRQNPLAYLP